MEDPELIAQFEQWRQARIRRVFEAIDAALKEMNCEIQAVPAIQDGRIVANIVIVAK